MAILLTGQADYQSETGRVSLTRSQRLVLTFLGLALASVVVIRVFAPDTFDQALRLPPFAVAPFLIGLAAFIAIVGVGVVRRWRWTFWLLLVANLAGVLRLVASSLELSGVLPSSAPAWYVTFQGGIGVVQFGLGAIMLRDYRRGGVWGASPRGQ